MDNEKLIAQISSTEDSSVDRVSLKTGQNTSLSAHMPQNEELRKKIIQIEGMAKSRLTKLVLQDSFEKLKNHLQYEYGDHLILSIKSSELTIYNKWIEGITLKDHHQKEEPLTWEDIARIKNKLRLWVRIFEHLSFFHRNGIIHGNIKPENILIRDGSTVDAKPAYDSEFFGKKMDTPQVILLDGGYSHLLEFQKESIDCEFNKSQILIEKKAWLSPEGHGFLEGSYKENSDIYSLAAVMAWDFGLIEANKQSVLNSIWSIYNPFETNSIYLDHKIYKWPNRNSLSDLFKRLRTILLRALEPMSEKRTITARDIAAEIMVMTSRLVDTLDAPPTEIMNAKFKEDMAITTKKEILSKSFELPDKVLTFLLKEPKLDQNRLWIEARNKTANKHAMMRSIHSGLNVIGNNCFYFGFRPTQSKIPFSNLDSFCNSLLSYVLYVNPQFLEEIRAVFNNIGTQLESIFFVLPSLANYADKSQNRHQYNKNNLIQVQHEYIQKNIENILIKIIHYSKLNFIILDDINRADHSSLSIIIKLLSHVKIKPQWIIGIRLDENSDSEATSKKLIQLKQKDLSFASLKENRTTSYWIEKMNTLHKSDAKILSIFSINPTEIDNENIEIFSNKFITYSGGFFNEKIFVSEDAKKVIEKEDLVPFEDQSLPLKTTNSQDEKQNKDITFLVYEVLRRAIDLGLMSEKRDIKTGYLMSYYWEHQFVLQCLSMLLSPKMRSEIYHSLCEIYHSATKNNENFSKIVLMADCLMKSKISQSHVGAYSSLTTAADELCDVYSAEYIIKKLQMLEEQIELERPKEAALLIPKIREKIADISRSINKNEIAVKYYDAVGWNIISRKKRSIILLKSFFPSQISSREQRTKEFYRIFKATGKSGFFPELKHIKSYELNDNIVNIINKIQKKLPEENSVYKSVRDNVMSYFLRSCIGWIDNSHVYPYIIKSLQFSVENSDAESTINLLFSLLFTCERNLSVKLRSTILETITDLAGRIGSTFILYEVLLTRAWFAFFYDGNLLECKKNIDRLNSFYNELSLSMRQGVKKLQILYEFESLSLRAIENQKDLIDKYMKKFQEFDLTNWNIGYEVFHLKHAPTSLKATPGNALFVGNILSEKIDQILLYSYLLIEEGQSNALSLVCKEAKNANIRPWFIDPSSHIEYIPEKIALSYMEYTTVKNVETNHYINKFKSLFLFKKLPLSDLKAYTGYWGQDKAVLYDLKIDIAKTQDSEKLHLFAKNLVRAGFLWAGFRMAHKARCDLAAILKEVRGLDNIEAGGNIVQERFSLYSEQGVALNYILEFLHNFQHQIQDSHLSDEELKEVSDFIRNSIPKETDLIESTLAGAIKALVKRMQSLPENGPAHDQGVAGFPKPQVALVENTSENEDEITRSPKAG
ncbi:MAG: hypothetical protein V4591_07455 [Bdellovibrionota bacterium]